MAGSKNPRRRSFFDIDEPVEPAATTKPTAQPPPPVVETRRADAGFTFKAKRARTSVRNQSAANDAAAESQQPTKKSKQTPIKSTTATAEPAAAATSKLFPNTTPLPDLLPLSNIQQYADILEQNGDQLYTTPLSMHLHTPISEGITTVVEHSLAELEKVLAASNTQHQWLIQHLRALTEQSLQSYTDRLHQQYVDQAAELEEQQATQQLNELVAGDVQQWMTALHSYGQNTSNIGKKGADGKPDPSKATTLNTAYQTFAIKGDAILAKLRNIRNAVTHSNTYTTGLIKSINQYSATLYGVGGDDQNDSKALVKSLLKNNVRRSLKPIVA